MAVQLSIIFLLYFFLLCFWIRNNINRLYCKLATRLPPSPPWTILFFPYLSFAYNCILFINILIVRNFPYFVLNSNIPYKHINCFSLPNTSKTKHKYLYFTFLPVCGEHIYIYFFLFFFASSSPFEKIHLNSEQWIEYISIFACFCHFV